MPAAAQSGNAAHGDKPGSDAGRRKEVKFEVISIRPLAFVDESKQNFNPTPVGFATPITIWQMIMVAYAPEDNFLWTLGHGTTNIGNAPPWLDDGYEIKARVSDEDGEAWRNQDRGHELLRSAMKALLKERCKLVIHQQPTEVPGLQLVIGKKGPKLKVTPPGFTLPEGVKLPSGGVVVRKLANGTDEYLWYGATMGDLAWYLSRTTLRPVHDMTGLTGRYDFTLQQIDHPSSDIDEMVYNWPIDALGLGVKSGKGSGITLVIDHIEKPTPN